VARRGQGIAHPHRTGLVGRRGEQADALQRPQPGGEDRRGDAVDLAGQFAEGALAVQQGSDEPQAPPVADQARGDVETVQIADRRAIARNHGGSISSLAIR